ncbi:MAG: GSCFA domain-containing protein [Rhodobacteraceae bacterium]|nr:GSCFA domain-containing protein [Paracoccaceae bacterium]
MTVNPYKSQPAKAFWKPAVAVPHYADLEDLWQPMPLTRADRVATAGSCFAQHLGNNLARRGAAFMDLEPAPPVFDDAAEARRWGYGVFSCRYGNIYTTRQLIQLFDEAHGQRTPAERVWQKGARFFDALRPGVDPVGQDSPETVLALREKHLARVREMFATLDVLFFTLGLTEGWEAVADGTMYPMAPGTVAGSHDPARYRFRNLRYPEVLADLEAFRDRLRAVNPGARMLLTVSPVPLTATATDDHVLVAATWSKAVLRAVAGDMAADHDDVFYFPSYEIIASHPSRGMYFNPDLRTVNQYGVDYVMTHFFSGPLAAEFADPGAAEAQAEIDLICDEEKLEQALD